MFMTMTVMLRLPIETIDQVVADVSVGPWIMLSAFSALLSRIFFLSVALYCFSLRKDIKAFRINSERWNFLAEMTPLSILAALFPLSQVSDGQQEGADFL